MGKKDIEDSLQRLDTLTQQEVRMASAELLKSTRNVEETMTGINNGVENVSERMHEMAVVIQRVDDKLDQANGSSFPQLTTHSFQRSKHFTGNQLRNDLLRWLLPPNPSSNHNIALKAHHNGTAQWLFQGSKFREWKSTGSFLWIHGKRTFLSASTS